MALPRKARGAGAKKAQEKAKLQDVREVTITLQATEEFLQRLAALLIFAPHVTPVFKPLPLLPWEDPDDPRFEKPPELEIDYDVVRRSIVKLLGQYVKANGEERARDVLKSFGADRLSSLPTEQLIPLNAALEAALQAEPNEKTE